jgi:hypothetical protein
MSDTSNPLVAHDTQMDKDNETMNNVSADMPDTTIEGRLANGEGDKILEEIRAEANTTERLNRAVALKALVQSEIKKYPNVLELYQTEKFIDQLIEETREALSNQVQELADKLTKNSLNTIINSSETNQSKSDQLSIWIENANCVATAWILVPKHTADLGALNQLIGSAKTKQQEIQNKVNANAQLRVAELDFAIKQPYVGSRDLNVFSERVNGLFKWHKKDYKRYLAPYFPIIQSSGMGKTKILVEYRSRQNVKSTYRVLLILCKTQGDVKTTDQRTYDHVLEVSDQSDIAARDHILENLELWTNKAREELDQGRKELDQGHKQDDQAQQIVLLFDEARSLLLIDEGFPFRCIRWWLRRQQHTKTNPVVAVFTGTDSALANFYR